MGFPCSLQDESTLEGVEAAYLQTPHCRQDTADSIQTEKADPSWKGNVFMGTPESVIRMGDCLNRTAESFGGPRIYALRVNEETMPWEAPGGSRWEKPYMTTA